MAAIEYLCSSKYKYSQQRFVLYEYKILIEDKYSMANKIEGR